MSSNFFRRSLIGSAKSWASVVAAVPVLIWTHDSFYTLCRVRGSSMDPTLKDGDVVLVRRSDHVWQQELRDFVRGRANDADDIEKDEEREKVIKFENVHCSQTGPGGLIRKPPVPATGDILVFRDPTEYPTKWNIKRAIGLGGQVLMMPSSRFDKSSNGMRYRMDDDDTSMRVVTPSVPPYSIWIEGDNTANSIDSKSHGPVSKKLVMGIAEYVLWPPSRMGTSLKSNVNPSMQPRAYWP